MGKKSANQKYMTPMGRASFMHVLRPTENLNGKLEYSLDLLIPKNRVKDLDQLKKKYTDMCREVWGKTKMVKRPLMYNDGGASDKAIVKDGDARYQNADPAKRETYAAYKGHVYIRLNLSADQGKPVVLDADNEEIIEATGIQSGDYVRCLAMLSTYTSKGFGPQFSVRLHGVQKLKDGEPLGNSSPSSDEIRSSFADAEDEYQDEYLDDELI